MTPLTAKELREAQAAYSEAEKKCSDALMLLKKHPDTAEDFEEEEVAFITGPWDFNFWHCLDLNKDVWFWKVSAGWVSDGGVASYHVYSKTKRGGLKKLLRQQEKRLADLMEALRALT